MEEEEAVPWVEKYRPRLLSDVLGSDDALKRLTVLAAEGNVPNLLFAVRGSWVIAAAAATTQWFSRRCCYDAGPSWHWENDQHDVPGTGVAGSVVLGLCYGAECFRRPRH